MCGAWGWRRRFFHKKNLLPRVWKWTVVIRAEEGVLPRDQRWKGSSAGSSGRRWRRFFRGIQRKKVLQVLQRDSAEERCLPWMPAPSCGRACRTFFRKLHVLLTEEPAELLSRTMFCCILVSFLKIMSEPPIYWYYWLVFIYLFAITKCICIWEMRN